MGPVLLHNSACCTTNTSKVARIGLCSFASSAIFTWPLTNQFSLLQAPRQLFACKMLPQPAGGRKCFPRVRQVLKHRFLRYRDKQTYFLTGKYVLIVMVPVLINKDVFESSYNDLKFMVQNNYFCTNLNTWCFTNYLWLYSFPSVFIFLVSRIFFFIKAQPFEFCLLFKLPFPLKSENESVSHLVMSDSSWPHGL